MHGACEQCEGTRAELAQVRARAGALAEQVKQLQVQLSEAMKLNELQQADLERYRKAHEATRPNHPERAPREQLQMAFERVLESLGQQPAANDESTANTDSETPTGDAAQQPQGNNNPPARGKRRHKHGRRKLDWTDLEVIEQYEDPAEVKAAGGQGYELIGEEVSQRVAWRRGAFVRHRLIRRKYKLIEELQESVHDEQDNEQSGAPSSVDEVVAEERTRILIAPVPENIWPNFMADPSAMSHVIVSKYGDILPLHRQETISARDGFALPRSTQCGWLKAAHEVTAPVVDAMFADGKRTAFLIATDATSAPVLPPRATSQREELWPVKRPGCDSWHVFVFIADRDHVVFRYDREHNGAVFERMLRGYRGNLLADAASVFDVLYRDHGMTEHGCWFHCRRPFYRALETEPRQALEALSLIGKLFEVDRQLRAQDLPLDAFTQQRAERARPLLKLLDDWVALHRDRVDPRGPLASGIGYYENQRDALHRFLNDGRIRLDNNLSEQALRNLVVGLANWQFFANETGLAWYTTFRSLIASCALHRLNPEIYVEQLLRIVPHWPKQRVLELSPKYWLQTISGLGERWRKMLERPWEPGIIASAQMSPPAYAPRREASVIGRAA